MTVADIQPIVWTLGAAARDCIENCGGDRAAAVEQLSRSIQEDPKLRGEIAEKAIEMGLKAAVAKEIHNSRQGWWRESSSEASELSGAQLRATATAGLYEYRLSSGRVLGDATRADVEAERDMHQQQARANRQRAVWYGSILDRLPAHPASKVRKALTENQLRELLEEAKASG